MVRPMPSPRLPVLLAFVFLLAAPAAGAEEQDRGSGIQQCERADGTRVYTDQDCGAFAAVPAPVEGELLMRLASDGSHDADAGAILETEPRPGSSSPPAPVVDTSPRGARTVANAARGCARSPTQLVMDLQDAWQRRDVNRLAASYHWAGSGTSEASTVMSRLQAMVEEPLLDIRHYPGSYGGLTHVAGVGGASAGDQLQVTLGDRADQPRDLRITRHQGCYFVRF